MKRFNSRPHGLRRFGLRFPHRLNRIGVYRGGERL